MHRTFERSPRRRLPLVLAVAAVGLLSPSTRAEGTAELGGNGRLQTTTPLRVDIIDAAIERIRWRGEGAITVRSPAGVVIATLANDETTGSLAATGPGAYELSLSANQNGTVADPTLPGNANFDVAVVDEGGAVVGAGRLFANLWNFVLGDRGQVRALDHSFFALVPAAPGTDSVVEVDFAGMNGNSQTFAMNSTGASARNDGRSSPASANAAAPQFPLYLNPPAVSRGGAFTPSLSGLRFVTSTDGLACNITGEAAGGFFAFETDAVGVAHVTCDLDGDGVASLVGLNDLNLLATTTPGTNMIPWDGTDGHGGVVLSDQYRCKVFVAVGELHFLGVDVETSFPGLRMYEVTGDGKTPLRMFWDDSLLPFADVPMPNGELGLLTSGPDGILSSPQAAAPVPNVSARSWGNFSANGMRGNDELTDTYTFANASLDAVLDLVVLPADRDDDGDGVSNADELCTHGTDPDDADSDDDGLSDGAEVAAGLLPLDADSDDDGLKDGTEAGVTAPGPGTDVAAGAFVADLDPTTTTDPLDVDTDDGGVDDGVEDANHDGRIDAGETDPTASHGADDFDRDVDGLADADEATLGTDPDDADSDDDGVRDGDERDPRGDADGDGVVNALDDDSDDDGLKDGTERGVATPGIGTDASAGHFVADADPSTTTDPLDDDTDDGGIKDGAEDGNHDGRLDAGEGNPVVGHGDDDAFFADADGDGVSDGLERAIGTDPGDADSDDDGVDDGDEHDLDIDSDGDGAINALDDDSDDDGINDGTEQGVTAPGPDTNTSAGHFVPDADPTTTTDPLDRDTDDGGVADGSEDENHDGAIDPGELNPNDPSDDATRDRDGDGIPDAIEDATGTDPDDADSDDDGLEDGVEDADHDGTVDAGETDPRDPDTDDDALDDGVEDADHDGTVDAGETDPRDPDTDSDTLLDGAEDENHDGVVDAGETDPRDPDTDDDGVCDEPTATVDGVCGDNADPDGDGALGLNDNCPDAANPDQADRDDDGIGDACDDDNADDDAEPAGPELTVEGSGVLSCASTSSTPAVPWLAFGAVLGVLRRRRRA